MSGTATTNGSGPVPADALLAPAHATLTDGDADVVVPVMGIFIRGFT